VVDKISLQETNGDNRDCLKSESPLFPLLPSVKSLCYPRNNHGSDVADKISLQETTEITEIV
jgi:hypothetical protein